MSSQLSGRLDELSQERARLRDSIRRIGETFASNLDRPALLELALRTAVDAVQASCGRLSVRLTSADPLAETVRGGLARRLRRAGPRRGALGAVPRRAGGGRVRSDERRVGRARPN